MAAPESHHHLSIRERTNPQFVWGPALKAQREGCDLTPDQERALDIRDLCIIVANTVTLLREDPQIKHNAFKEADALLMLHQGMSKIIDLGITPFAHLKEEKLDTPLKIAEYVAGQLLLIDINNIPNINHQINPPPSGIAADASWYMYDMSLREEDPVVEEDEDLEFDMGEEEAWDVSMELWDELVEIIWDDQEVVDQLPEHFFLLGTDDYPMEEFEAEKKYPKKNGQGSFTFRATTAGIEIEERDRYEDYLGSAFVLGPGKTEGHVGFTENKSGSHTNTNIAEREVRRIIAEFRDTLF